MKSSDARVSTLVTPQRFIGRTLFWMRWTTIALVSLLVLLQPAPPLARLPSWALLLLFAGYNGLNGAAATEPVAAHQWFGTETTATGT